MGTHNGAPIGVLRDYQPVAPWGLFLEGISKLIKRGNIMAAGIAQKYFSHCMSGAGFCLYAPVFVPKQCPNLMSNAGYGTEMLRDNRFIDNARSVSKHVLHATFENYASRRGANRQDIDVLIFSNSLSDIERRIEAVSDMVIKTIEEDFT